MEGKKKKIAIILLFLIFTGNFSSYRSVSAVADSGLTMPITPPSLNPNSPTAPTTPGTPPSTVPSLTPSSPTGQSSSQGAQQETWWEGASRFFANPFDAAVKSFVGGIALILTALPSFLLEVGQTLLSWVISSDFMGIGMTTIDPASPNFNPIVGYGWPIARDFANIFLLLGLIIIGLGIILGIEEYQAKKTLPKLIAIAILINFTLVICGFIIDFTNLLMNYLLGTGSLPNTLINEITQGITNIVIKGKTVEAIAIIIVYFAFGMVAFITYLLYALLFIARYVFLWILIIFSPIAFVSNVFPENDNVKKFFPSFFYWKEWWSQFIQWSVVGIYAAFFLALANKLMYVMASGKAITSTPSGAIGIMGGLFTYLFPLALLLIGFFSVLETGAPSVPGIKSALGSIARIDKEGRIKLGAVGGAAAAAGGLAIGAAAGGIVGAGKGWTGGTGGLKGKTEESLKGVARGALTGGGREEGKMWFRRKAEEIPLINRFIGRPGATDRDFQNDLDETKKEIEAIPDTPDGNKKIAEGLHNWPMTKFDYLDRRLRMETLLKRKEVPKEDYKKFAADFQQAGGNPNFAARVLPNLASYLTIKDPKTGALRKMTIKEATDKILPKDVVNDIQKDAININVGDTAIEIEQKREAVVRIGLDEAKLERVARDMKVEIRKGFRDLFIGTNLKAMKLTPEEEKSFIARVSKIKSDPRFMGV